MSTNKPTKCHGCSNTFESYDMTPEEGYKYQGKIYCSDSCQQECEVDEMENEMYMEECGLNSDGSEW